MSETPVEVVRLPEDKNFWADVYSKDLGGFTVRYFGPNGKDFSEEDRNGTLAAIRESIVAILRGLRQKWPNGITEEEYKVIDILTQCGEVRDAHTEPIYAVDRAMGWPTAASRLFVERLINRELLVWYPIARDGMVFDPKACWKKGPSYPGEPTD